MQKFKFTMMAFCLLMLSTIVVAQQKGQKKGGERQLAQYEKMATELNLTPEQKATAIQLSNERMKTQSEKLKAATTEEEKKAVRKAVNNEYNSKLDASFGKDMANKMRDWLKKNAPQKQQKKAPQSAE